MGNRIGGRAAERARVRAFDGIRGLAVVAVVLFHAQVAAARGGFLGVSAFFTLSGFLITSLLLQERAQSGGIALRAFWSRRARRLLPAAYVTLAGVLAFGATLASIDQLRALRGDVLGALAYVANWRFLFAGRSYEHLFSAPSPVLHFWSLAIEEQFYLLFPLLLLAAVRVARGRRLALGALLGTGIAASVVAGNVLLASSGTDRVYYGTDTRAAELLVGALLAVVVAHRQPRARRPGAELLAGTAGVAALTTMVWWWCTVDQQTRWLYRGGFALHAALTAIVIAAARRRGPFAWFLGLRPLVLLGRLSYGIYLFHWPIFLWLSPERTGWSGGPLLAARGVVTLACASLSYVLVEQPVLRGARLRGHWPKVVAPSMATALVAGLLVVTWSPPAPQIVIAVLDEAPSTIHIARPITANAVHERHLLAHPKPKPRAIAMYRPTYGSRPLRITVVGDSVGLTLGRGLELWAEQHGIAAVANIARKYCPLGRTLPAIQGIGGPNESMAYCDWTRRWRANIDSFDPDVVVVLFTIWESAPRDLPNIGFRQPGDPALDQWQLTEYQNAVDALTARGAHVVWLNAPCAQHFPITPGQPLYTVDRRTLPRLARTRRGVHLIDLESQLCKNGQFQDAFMGVGDGRPDGAHFSDAGAFAVANWLMPILLGQTPPPQYRRS